MSYNCCSENFSSRSLGGYLHYPDSSCGSSYPRTLVYRIDLHSPSTCQLGSSLSSGCQKICWEPTRCQTSCYRPETSTLWSLCRSTYAVSLGSGSRSCYSLGCGSCGFRPLGYGVCGFPSLSYGARFCHPIYFASRSC